MDVTDGGMEVKMRRERDEQGRVCELYSEFYRHIRRQMERKESKTLCIKFSMTPWATHFQPQLVA